MALIPVRAKVVCASQTKYRSDVWNNGQHSLGYAYKYAFNFVTGNSEENKVFFASTPSGTLELHAVRDNLFELGEEYYLDFIPAKQPDEAPMVPPDWKPGIGG